eukprot:scaffold15335_cov234-Alexandrium_tamarense.AAC.1
MLERYLLSTLTTKFDHIFQDFDTSSTSAELSAWRGVLVLRNLKLREDALKGFGGVLGVDDDDDDDGIEEEDWGGDSSDSSSFQHQQQQQQAERAVFQEIQSAMKEMNINSSSTDSDDDSFRSCASHID